MDGLEYERRLMELAAALRRKGPERPPRGAELELPPGSGYRAEGALRRTLRIRADEVALLEEGEAVASHRSGGLTHGIEERLWELERARRRGPELLEQAPADAPEPADSKLQGALLEGGSALGRAFLAGAAGTALQEAVGEAERGNRPLELGLEPAEELAEDPGRLIPPLMASTRPTLHAGEEAPANYRRCRGY